LEDDDEKGFLKAIDSCSAEAWSALDALRAREGTRERDTYPVLELVLAVALLEPPRALLEGGRVLRLSHGQHGGVGDEVEGVYGSRADQPQVVQGGGRGAKSETSDESGRRRRRRSGAIECSRGERTKRGIMDASARSVGRSICLESGNML
jgi:hypothetical protein